MNKWYKDKDVVELIISAMTEHYPQPKRGRKIPYRKIAEHWAYVMPLLAYSKKKFSAQGEFLQINIREMREAFPYQYQNKQRWFVWFEENFPIWRITSKGNMFIGNSYMMPLIPLQTALEMSTPEAILEAHLLSVGDEDVSAEETPVDIENLQRYIRATKLKLQENKSANYKRKLHKNLEDAVALEKLALAFNKSEWVGNTEYMFVPQYYRQHEWGREYGVGSFSIQYMGSQVREAAMGPGYTIDLNSSVYMFYKMLANQAGIPSVVLTELQENKHQFRAELAECLSDTDASPAFKQQLVKQAITCLGFGSNDGNYSSVSKIVRNTEDRKRLTEHPKWRELKTVIKGVYAYVKTVYADEIEQRRDEFSDEANRFNMRKFMAMFYQRYESLIMQEVMQELSDSGREVWLSIHDGVMTRRRPDSVMIQKIVQDFNPYASIEVKQHEEYVVVDKNAILTIEQEHSERMATEQQRAEQWAADNNISTRTALERLSEFNPQKAMQLMLQENDLFETDTDLEGHYTGQNTW